jgi:hypothetical protein
MREKPQSSMKFSTEAGGGMEQIMDITEKIATFEGFENSNISIAYATVYRFL